MSRYQCPICGNEQEFGPEKAYGFCQRCGTKLLLRRSAAEKTPENDPAEEPLQFIPEDPAEEEQELPKIALTETGKLQHPDLRDPEQAEPEPGLPIIPLTETEEIESEDEREEEQEEESRSGRRTGLIIAACVLAAAGLLTAAYFLFIRPAASYRLSETNRQNGRYQEAIDGFKSLGNYRDSALMLEQTWLEKALWELQNGRLAESAASLSNVHDPAVDTSLYDAMAGSHLQKLLIQDYDYEKAQEALSQLPAGHVKGLDDAFETALRRTLDEKDYKKAVDAYAGIGPYLKDPDGVRTMIVEEQKTLMDAGDFAHALELSQQFAEVLADPKEDVTARFDSLLDEGQYFLAAAMLEVFEPEIGNRTYYEKAIETKLLDLMEKQEDEAVAEMAYAFHDFRNLDLTIAIKASDYLEECGEKKDWGRLAQILGRYSSYNEHLQDEADEIFTALLDQEAYDDAEALIAQLEDGQVNKKEWQYTLTERCMETQDWERAKRLLAGLEGYKDSDQMGRELIYRQILKLWDEGKNEEADRLIEELGDSQESREIVQEAQMRAARALIEKENPTPEDFREAYSTLYGIRSHEGAADERTNVLERWADMMLDNTDRRPYLEAMSSMGFVSTANRAHICAYLIEKTPALAGHSENGATWMMTDEWLPYNVYRFLEQVSDGAGVTRSFIQYAMSMAKENTAFSISDLWNLWNLREDVRALCRSNDYMIFFLSGVWTSADGAASLTVMRNNGVFVVEYNIPPTAAGAGIRAERFGLASGSGRLCDIEIVDFNTIRLTNSADGKTYTLTRP